MDFVVRLFRVLAFEGRLRIIQKVLSGPGVTVAQIARALNFTDGETSKHLKLLRAHGLVDARPSGRFVLTSPADPANTRHELLKAVRKLIQRELAGTSLAQAARSVCPHGKAEGWGAVFHAMCFDFTAYTHLRRLLILRVLMNEKVLDGPKLCDAVGMSPPAARRHIDKLVRRGLLVQVKEDGRWVMSLNMQPSTRFRRGLLKLVAAYLADAQQA